MPEDALNTLFTEWLHSCTCYYLQSFLKCNTMDLHNEQLPATLQAFDLADNQEVFLAEQVVNSQAEIVNFTNRYSGKLIKAKLPVAAANGTFSSQPGPVVKSKSSVNAVMVVVVLVLLALAVYGFSTGWIQEKLHLNI